MAAYVKLGTAPGRYHKTAKGKHSLVYRYVYGPGAGLPICSTPHGALELKWHGLSCGAAAGTWCFLSSRRRCIGRRRQSAEAGGQHTPVCMPAALPGPHLGALPADAGNTTYQSPILHHVLLRGLKPGKTYFYVVGERLG